MLVREHIKFERGKDPKDAMGVGEFSRIKKEIRQAIKHSG